MSMRSKHFSIIIPTKNRLELLKKALQSVSAQAYPKDRIEVIVVNDGSIDGTRRFLENFTLRAEFDIKAIDNDGKEGVSHARNIAIMASSGDIVASLDDDCEASSNWLETLDSVYASDASLMCVGVNLLNATPENIFSRFAHNFQVYAINTAFKPLHESDDINLKFQLPQQDTFVAGCLGANSSYRRELFDQVGLFNEDFPSAEDIELNIRIGRKFGFLFTPKTSVTHHYRTTFFGLMRQFYGYGRGGPAFRRIMAEYGRGPGLMKSVARFIRFASGISRSAATSRPEEAFSLVIAVCTQAAMIAGEASELLSNGRSWRGG